MLFRRIRPCAWTICCLFLALGFVLTGCGSATDLEPSKISLDPHASGNEQCGMHGELLPDPLKVVVESSVRKGLLGGKGSRRSVPDAQVTFEIVNPDTGAVLLDDKGTALPVQTVRTDKAGSACARLRLGNYSGDVFVSASVDTPDGLKKAEFRAVTGVERLMSVPEGPTGGTIDEIGLHLVDLDGQPAEGVLIVFRVASDGYNAAVGGNLQLKVRTDAAGKAAAPWQLGSKMQQYFALAEIIDDREGITEDRRFHAQAIEFTAMATDKKSMVITLFGGLAVFIFGMKLMSGGLQRMADRRLKAILQTVTRNRFFATGVGAGLTAMIQSSSATTVMTVGFVNAGLITLTQAIGVVYGANIGTTITGQIIAFKLDALAYPAIAVGLALSALCRKPFHKHLGETILGFGLLFLGMTTMSSVLKPLKHSPEFISLFQMFDCTPDVGGHFVKAPQALMCIFIGTAATCVIQSSSATVGLVLALSSQGLVSFYTAVPLILGDNIGTTITAILASLGANRNAKRAALAHTMFNVFGAAYMYVLLFVPFWHGQPVFLGFIDWLTPGEVFVAAPENLPRHVANAHTFFNVFNVVLFLPFVPIMARVCRRIIPVSAADEEQVLKYLEPHLLQSPALAVQQAVREVAYMVQRAQKSINEGCQYFCNGDRRAEETITTREDVIDRLQHEVTAYLVELSRMNLAPDEANLIPALIHAVNDAERIGDHSENLLELTHLKQDGKFVLSDEALDDLRKLQELLNEQFEATCQSLVAGDADQVAVVLEKEREITKHMQQAAEAHVKRLEEDRCSVQSGVVFLDFLAHLERVGDHLTNIAERAGKVIQLMT